ncbi:MAG: proteinase inhibitor serpin [Frankiales bacterium]|nr:proteinase inhibitor serpin [Frankiales bacterium]
MTLLSGSVRQVALGSLTARGLADAQRSFGADLLKAVCTKEGTGNVTVSPASAALALGQLDAGARRGTRAKIDALLHLPGWNDDVVAAYRAQRLELAGLTQLQVSNHVYSAYGNPPERATLDDFATGFGSKLAQLDFTKPAATDAINADVSKDTKGLIPKLFDEPLDPSTVTVLTNALHLKADWATPFDMTTDTPFTTDADKTVTAHMMSAHELAASYRSADGWQSAELPYAGNQLTAYAILPPKGSTCRDVSGSTLTALTTGPSAGETTLQMPTVDLAQKHDLYDVMKALGLPMDGDYSGLGPQADGISTVVQKVVLKVDKKGTEAAAATGIGVFTSGLWSGPAHALVLDRPYLLVIQDTKTGTPLFLARVADPTRS